MEFVEPSKTTIDPCLLWLW